MLSRECTGLCQPSACLGGDGQLWFPTMDGAVHFDPTRLPLNREPPPVAILDCRANGHSLKPTDPLRAGPGRPSLEFRYTAFSFAAPEKTTFRVRMAGFAEGWRDVGPHRFEVQAANGDGIWNNTGASMSVNVLPFFWEAPWFRRSAVAAFAFAAVGAGWLIARARMRREVARLEQQRARELERARIAQDLHDDLGASLTEISLLARLAAEEQPDSAHSRETLPEIATKAQSLVGTLDEIVWAVNPRHDTIESLAEYLAAFAAEFLDAAGITLRLDIPRELPATVLDTEQRHDLFLAAREALNNSVKHSAATEITIQLRADAERLGIVISDNGRGFDPAQRSEGNGATNISARLSRLGGACQVQSTIGAGTSVRLTMPLHTK
jgi:signal transduction histidine kinase